jgi:hypothetical protein
MTEKITHIVLGRISAINNDKRIMWVKENDSAVTFELKWRVKPEVVDDLCQKQKAGYRVKVTTTKDPTEENPQFWISNVEFDDSYKKRKGAYAPSPEEQKLILLQSCQRSGAIVFAAMLGMPNVVADKEEQISKTYDAIMNKLRERAIADAAAFQEEAKKG